MHLQNYKKLRINDNPRWLKFGHSQERAGIKKEH